MNRNDTSRRKSSRSLARKLNAELVWRKCFRNILFILLLLSLAFGCWCIWQELETGQSFGSASDRRFTGSVNFFPDGSLTVIAENTADDAKNLLDSVTGNGETEVTFSRTAVFRDVNYLFEISFPEDQTFTDPETGEESVIVTMKTDTHSADCTAILNVGWWLLVILVLLNVLAAFFRTLTGSSVISKYLRPIDEIAAMAEKLSSDAADRHTATVEQVRQTESELQQSIDRAQEISGDVQSLAVAIDRIDDSGTRIEVHDTELGGLEAALNNMLKRLDESKRSQIRFVDDASHELRTPIAVIQGYVNMLDRWGKEDPKVRDEAIAAIKSESEHMRTLIDQLLFLARGEMDRHVLTMEQVNLYECLDEILEESVMLDQNHRYILAAPEESEETIAPENVKENGSKQAESPNDDLPDLCVTADAAMLKQAIRILRDNAAKYTPEGGEITFRAAEHNGEVTIEVKDTGIGIPAEEIPRIFDRFYRGSNARADNAGGSGLGLSIAKWIVDQHGGRIEAVSVPELGTKMKIVMKK